MALFRVLEIGCGNAGLCCICAEIVFKDLLACILIYQYNPWQVNFLGFYFCLPEKQKKLILKLYKGVFLMKKIAIRLSLVFSIFFFFTSHAIASDSYINTSGERFVSGVANAATGWVELPKNIVLTGQKDGPIYGGTVGLAMGIMHTVGRSIVGALDAATFWVPLKPSVNPPYIWEDFSRETTY